MSYSLHCRTAALSCYVIHSRIIYPYLSLTHVREATFELSSSVAHTKHSCIAVETFGNYFLPWSWLVKFFIATFMSVPSHKGFFAYLVYTYIGVYIFVFVYAIFTCVDLVLKTEFLKSSDHSWTARISVLLAPHSKGTSPPASVLFYVVSVVSLLARPRPLQSSFMSCSQLPCSMCSVCMVYAHITCTRTSQVEAHCCVSNMQWKLALWTPWWCGHY